MKGSYVLVVHLPEAQSITIGRLGDVYFRSGYYAYVGSAMGGLSARLNRHLQRVGRPHWHIDYLREKASVTGIFLAESQQRYECAMAQAFEGQLDSVANFDSSDCQCRSHLFFSPDESQIKQVITEVFDRLKLRKNQKMEIDRFPG